MRLNNKWVFQQQMTTITSMVVFFICFFPIQNFGAEIPGAVNETLFIHAKLIDPTIEDSEFLTWWMRFLFTRESREALNNKNEIQIIELKNKALANIKSHRNSKYLAAYLTVRLGDYDFDKQVFPIEFPFVTSKSKNSLQWLDTKQCENWLSTVGRSDQYTRYNSSDMLDKNIYLNYFPDQYSNQRPFHHLEMHPIALPSWEGLKMDKVRASELLSFIGPSHYMPGVFIFEVEGSKLEKQDIQAGVFNKNKKTIYVPVITFRPVALFLWASGGNNPKVIDLKPEHAKFIFKKYITGLGYVKNPSTEPRFGKVDFDLINSDAATKANIEKTSIAASRERLNLPTDADLTKMDLQIELVKKKMYLTKRGTVEELLIQSNVAVDNEPKRKLKDGDNANINVPQNKEKSKILDNLIGPVKTRQ